MDKIKITYVGDEKGLFPQRDYNILSKDYDINLVYFNLMEKNYIKFLKIGLSSLLISILNTSVSITWTVDVHTAYVVLISKIFGKKTIVIVAGYEVCNMPEINYGLQLKPIRGWISRWVLNNADAVIVPSVAYQQKVKELVGRDADVVPNCSEIHKSSPIAHKLPVVTMAISQYGNANDFAALKGMITYNAIAKAMKGTSFFVIGGADEQLIDMCNNLIFTGCLEHHKVQELLNLSKVYCQLSYTESFGVALLEAIQLGCIPVVTDKDGMSEIVQDCGHKILYGDVGAGINAVKQAMADTCDRSEIISDSRDKYSKEQRRHNFINVIDKVMYGK